MKLKVLEYDDKHENYIRVRIDRANYIENKKWRDVELWCQKTQCGKRVNHNSFAFKTEAEYMMFKLRWL